MSEDTRSDSLDDVTMHATQDGKGIVFKMIDADGWAEIVLSLDNAEIFADCVMNLAQKIREKNAERLTVS